MSGPLCDKCSIQAGGVFRCLGARHMALLIGERTAHQYEAGERIYFEGNPALAVYCIQRGKVKLSRLLPGGDEHVIGLRGAGDLIGYRCLLTSRTYCVTAEAYEPTVACAIPREVFRELLRDSNELAHALLLRLAMDSVASEDLLMSRALELVRTRLARFLVSRIPPGSREAARDIVIPLGLRREEIAHLIDTTPATLSRTLQALTRKGVIEPRRADIRVLNVAALERIARVGNEPEGRSGMRV